MLSKGENDSSIPQVFDTMPGLTMLSLAGPEKTDVQSLLQCAIAVLPGMRKITQSPKR